MARGGKKAFYIIFWSLFAAPIIFMAVLFYLISIGKMGYIPPFEVLENPKSNLASEIISADNIVLGKYFEQNRSNVNYDEISPYIIDALLATEDIRFLEHSGIDLTGLARVFVKTVILRHDEAGGGSTITQQLAKILYHDQAKSFWERIKQKLNEWVISVKLERSYTKQEIMTMYLNQFDFLNLAVGIKSASKVYFNTYPDSLKIEEAAMLVGMLKNPAYFNPVRNDKFFKRTLGRRNVVLQQMLKYEYITQSQYDSLSNLPMTLNYQKVDHNLGLATYFREYLRTTLQAQKPDREKTVTYQQYIDDSTEWATNPLYGWCNKNFKPGNIPYDIYTDGIKIYTTLDSRMQNYAEEAVNEHIGTYLQKEFYKEKKGKKKGPFSNDVTQEQIDQIIESSMKRSERYRVLKKAKWTKDSIEANFAKPVDMKVFSWHGEIDTVMSPIDSIYYYKYFLNAGFISVEPKTGFVRAYVGGLDYRHFKYDHVTEARRQVGSTFKPFIYTLAMMPGEKFDPCYRIPNVPVTIELPPGSPEKFYTPKFSNPDYLKKYEGQNITLKFGLSHSLNQVSAFIMNYYRNPQAVVQIARDLGVRSPLEPVYSLCVGAAEVKLYEMAGAYTAYANKGIYTQPIFVTRIEDKNGNIISKFQPTVKDVLDEETAYKMLVMLKGVTEGGTSVRLRNTYKFEREIEIAGKTGTTNDNSDGWFIGFTPELLSGIWVGGEVRSIRFNNTRIGQGNQMSLPIWAIYMKKVWDDKTLPYSKEAKFEIPASFRGNEFNCPNQEESLPGNEGQDENFENLFN